MDGRLYLQCPVAGENTGYSTPNVSFTKEDMIIFKENTDCKSVAGLDAKLILKFDF